jgi:hypothetical protein
MENVRFEKWRPACNAADSHVRPDGPGAALAGDAIGQVHAPKPNEPVVPRAPPWKELSPEHVRTRVSSLPSAAQLMARAGVAFKACANQTQTCTCFKMRCLRFA